MAIRDLLVRIRGDSSEVDRELLRTSRSVQKFGRDMAQVGTRLTVGVTVPILGAGAAALTMAAQAQESEAKFGVVFGNMAEDVREFSETTATALGRSAVELRGFASSFQDTFVPLGFARSEAAALSKTLVAATLDLGAFYDQAEPEVVQRLTSALVGNHEAVRQFGVVLTAATLDQELLRMGIEGGTKAATNQEKVLARLNLILGQTADASGTAAREADGATAGWRSLTATVRDLVRLAGDELLPLANEIQRALTGQLRTLLEVNPETVRWGLALAGALAVIGPTVTAAGLLVGVLGKIATALSVGLLPLIGVGGTVVLGLTTLAAAFLKVKLEAAAAREEVRGTTEDLRGMTREQLFHLQTVNTLRLLDVKDAQAAIEATRDASGNLAEDAARRWWELDETAQSIIRNSIKIGEALDQIAPLAAIGDDPDPAAGGSGPRTPASASFAKRRGLLAGWDLPRLREIPLTLRATTREVVILEDSLRPLEETALGFVDAFGDTLGAALRDGRAAFQRFADYVVQQIARVVAKLALFRILQSLFPGSGFVAQFGLQSGFLSPRTITTNQAVGGVGAGAPIVFDFSKLPPPLDPRQGARDPVWQRFLVHTLREAGYS